MWKGQEVDHVKEMNEMINRGLRGMASGDKCCNLSVAENRHLQANTSGLHQTLRETHPEM